MLGVGDEVRVRDRKDLKFYDCVVVEVKEGEEKCKVHYKGWRTTHDEWIPMDSDRIQLDEATVMSSTCPSEHESVGSVASFVASLEAYGDGNISAAEVHRRTSVGGSFTHTPLQSRKPESTVACKSGDLAGGGRLAVDATVTCGDSAAHGRPDVHCSFCTAALSGGSVSCSVCCGKFHPDVSCLGVDEDVVRCLLKDTRGAVLYSCCRCRCSGRTGAACVPGEETGLISAFNQLLVAVGSLTKRVDEISRRFESASTSRNVDASHVGPAAYEATVSREVIRVELRELHEQDRRHDSIVLRGFRTGSAETLREKFMRACLALDVGEVELTGLVRIGDTSLFRAKVLDREQRRTLLDCAKNLRHLDEFKSVYIQRDLTYRQRQEIIARRAAVEGREATAGLGATGDRCEDVAGGRSGVAGGRGGGAGGRGGAGGSSGGAGGRCGGAGGCGGGAGGWRGGPGGRGGGPGGRGGGAGGCGGVAGGRGGGGVGDCGGRVAGGRGGGAGGRGSGGAGGRGGDSGCRGDGAGGGGVFGRDGQDDGGAVGGLAGAGGGGGGGRRGVASGRRGGARGRGGGAGGRGGGDAVGRGGGGPVGC